MERAKLSKVEKASMMTTMLSSTSIILTAGTKYVAIPVVVGALSAIDLYQINRKHKILETENQTQK